MAEVYPLKETPRSDGGCSIVEFTNDDYLGISALPNALPDDWDEFDIGHTLLQEIRRGISGDCTRAMHSIIRQLLTTQMLQVIGSSLVVT